MPGLVEFRMRDMRDIIITSIWMRVGGQISVKYKLTFLKLGCGCGRNTNAPRHSPSHPIW